MPTNLILLSNPTEQAVSRFNKSFYGEGDREDLFFHLGTELSNSSASYTNPVGNTVSITVPEGAISSGSLSNLTSRSNSTLSIATFPTTLQFELLNNYKVDINSYSFKTSSSSNSHPRTWEVYGSDDGLVWTQLHRAVNRSLLANSTFYDFNSYNNLGTFKYIRFRFISPGSSGILELDELRLFGVLQNLVTGVAGYLSTGDNVLGIKELDVRSAKGTKVIKYDSSDQVWESESRFPWELKSLILTSNQTIVSAYKPIFWVVSPDANRELYLPVAPVINDCVRIKNLVGSFSLTIKETAASATSIILSNTSGKLQCEFYYDGVDWLPIG